MTTLKIYKTHPNATIPQFATKQSACFDLTVCFDGQSSVKGYDSTNAEFIRTLSNNRITIMPGERMVLPTGLIFDIPAGYSVRVHSRSGLSLKQGLVLANLEGVIDSDYYHETAVLLHNVSNIKQTISNGDRIAQAELVKSETYKIAESKTKPTQRTERKGGMGSTGVSKNA